MSDKWISVHRDVPYDNELKCDCCGGLGAFDFMGDYYCSGCLHTCEKCECLVVSKKKIKLCPTCREEPE